MARLEKLLQLNQNGTVSPVPEFYLDLGSGVIQFIKWIEGRMFQRSTGVKVESKKNPVLSATVRKAKEIANQKLKREINSKKVGTTIAEEWEIYYAMREAESLRGEISSATLVNVKRAGKRIKEFFGDIRPAELTKEKWLEFVAWHEQEYPGETLFNARKYLRHFSQHLHEKIVGGRPLLPAVPTLKNPFAKRERLNAKRKKDRVFTSDEVKKILSVCDEREQLIILFMYMMAFRIESEGLSVEWSQLKLDQDPPVYVFGEEDNKAELEGKQAIPELIVPRLRAWYPKAKHSRWVFPQEADPEKHLRPQMIDWEDIRKKANLGWHWTSHFFRHSCFTTLAEAGHPMHLICKLYRISPKHFLETYSHLTPEGVKRMQNAISLDGISPATVETGDGD